MGSRGDGGGFLYLLSVSRKARTVEEEPDPVLLFELTAFWFGIRLVVEQKVNAI
jgi:hypothetical protein